MDGRWNLMVTPDGRAPGAAKAPDQAAIRNGWSCVPVVPCDDAAVERAVRNVAGVQFEASEQARTHAGVLVAIVVHALRADGS